MPNEEYERAEKERKLREKQELEKILSICVNTVETMMSRQRKCEDRVVKYSLLANTLMMVFDIASASLNVLSTECEPELKAKVRTTINGVQKDLEEMLSFIQQRHPMCA